MFIDNCCCWDGSIPQVSKTKTLNPQKQSAKWLACYYNVMRSSLNMLNVIQMAYKRQIKVTIRTSHVFHEWETAHTGSPCSKTSCCRSASGWGPWQRGNGSYLSTDCAATKQKRSYYLPTLPINNTAEICALKKSWTLSYRPAFVFLRCVEHCFVPCSSTIAAHFVHIELPIPATLVNNQYQSMCSFKCITTCWNTIKMQYFDE